jgi:hypothetical protein
MNSKHFLAFLQNQWFKNPERVREMMDRKPESRQWFIKQFLFAGCLTGRRLISAFGQDLVDQIVWEEISPQIGSKSGSWFDPDPVHIAAMIQKFQPRVIICFGTLAAEGVRDYLEHQPGIQRRLTSARAELTSPFIGRVLYAPHPAARNNPMPALCELARQLKQSRSVALSLNEERNRQHAGT